VVQTETQVREHGPQFVPGEQSRYSFRGTEPVFASEAVPLLKQLMWKKAGIIRNATELRECGKEIEHIREKYGSHPLTEGLFVTAKAIVAGALTREESRGAHFRSDLPEPCPTWENRHTVWRPKHEYSPIT
jgi:L-aspartate oxidase